MLSMSQKWFTVSENDPSLYSSISTLAHLRRVPPNNLPVYVMTLGNYLYCVCHGPTIRRRPRWGQHVTRNRMDYNEPGLVPGPALIETSRLAPTRAIWKCWPLCHLSAIERGILSMYSYQAPSIRLVVGVLHPGNIRTGTNFWHCTLMVPHWETRPPAPWPDISLSRIILTLSQPDLVLSL